MITFESYGQRERAFGFEWVRTDMTMNYLGNLTSAAEFAEFADAINASLAESPVPELRVQANGWALVPDGYHAEYAAALVDTAVEMVVESYR